MIFAYIQVSTAAQIKGNSLEEQEVLLLSHGADKIFKEHCTGTKLQRPVRSSRKEQIAKTKSGYKEGRPKRYTQEQIDYTMSLLENHSYSEVERMTQISRSTLVREYRRI